MEKRHREEKWVEKLCNEIKESKKFKKWSEGKTIIIKDRFALAHSMNLNHFLVFETDESEK